MSFWGWCQGFFFGWFNEPTQPQEERTAVEQKDEEVKLLQESMTQLEHSNHQKYQKIRSALEEKEKQLTSLKERNAQMEQQYSNMRTALKEKNEELKSFKDRLAKELALSIRTGKTESMNNPVSKTRLKELYDELRQKWPNIKHNLKSSKENSEFVQALIQKKFQDAAKEMEQKKRLIDQVFRLPDVSHGPQSHRVKEYRQSVVQILQLALYQSRNETVLQTFGGHESGKKQDVLEYLGSECYWLGSLMALNSPPLQLDWKNHDPGMDPWNIFPRDVRAATSSQRNPRQHQN